MFRLYRQAPWRRRPSLIANRAQLIAFQPRRPLHWWRLPVAVLTASKSQRRIAATGVVGSMVLAGLVLGPTFFIFCGGLAAFFSWRVWQRTSQWWQFMDPQQQQSLYSMLKTQVGRHRAEEQVRTHVIDCITQWAQSDDGKRVLAHEFQLEHSGENDTLVFLPTHASRTSTFNVTGGTKATHIALEFFMEPEPLSVDDAFGGCMVSCEATIDDHTGAIRLENITLASPNAFKVNVPVDPPKTSKSTGRVIEGEFKDI
ncbi:hypothetical protein BC940DRAFT_288755 [Gongronella butleri]|nr:hypothetical protein BC940DRAFT_288755 [Gongronella butleri]